MKALVLAALVAHAVAGASAEECVAIDSSELDHLHTWDEYYGAYLRHGRCADGVIAGRFSEGAALLLARQWETTEQLERLAEKDATFLRFVAGVLGDSVPLDEWTAIKRNVQTRCANTVRSVCDALRELE